MANETVNVNFRMDAKLKKDMEYICGELGLTMTGAFNIFAKKMSREQRIPFDMSVDPFYSKENIERLKKSISQLEDSGGTIHEVSLDD